MKTALQRGMDASTVGIICSEVGMDHQEEILRQSEQLVRYMARYGEVLERLDAGDHAGESSVKTALACILRAQALVELAVENLDTADDALSGLRTASEIGFPEFDHPEPEQQAR